MVLGFFLFIFFLLADEAGQHQQQQTKSMVKELPLGCYGSSLNSSLLFSSSGHAEIDEIIGGGLVVGSMCLFEQDVNTRYWNSFAKYSAGEGICCGQGRFLLVLLFRLFLISLAFCFSYACSSQGLLVVGGPDCDLKKFVETDIPAPTESLPKEEVSTQPMNVDGIKIAWRYKAQLMERIFLAQIQRKHHKNATSLI